MATKVKAKHEPKTTIGEVPIANPRIYKEVARIMKTDPMAVEEQIRFVGKFIEQTIRKGNMEAVMIPYFGKFKPKLKHLQARNKINADRVNGKDLMKRALLGKRLLDLRPKPTAE